MSRAREPLTILMPLGDWFFQERMENAKYAISTAP